MKAYERKIEYNFICKGCDSLITAESTEFEVLDAGLLGYRCPICKKKRKVRYKDMTRKVLIVYS